MARLEMIRLVIALAAQRQWTIYQLDVKSAFLHGELNKEVFLSSLKVMCARAMNRKSIGSKRLYTDLSKLHELGIVV